MAAIFETSNKDIERLDAKQLASLLMRLLTLEAAQNRIPQACVQGSLQITVSDEGEDAHINWEGGPEHTDWIPNRYTLFQCKATDTGPRKCEKEVVKPDGSGIKSRVDEVLSAGGAYILFCTTSCNTKMSKARIAAIRKALRRHRRGYAFTADIRVYDANRISRWANAFVSAVTAVRNDVGPHLPRELKTWREWSGYPENKTPFVSDAKLQKDIVTLRTHFLEPRRVERMIGLSGVGKTRLAFETFRPPPKPADDFTQYALSAGCVYVDAGHAPDDLPGLLSEWVRMGISGTIVVDNCPLSLHKAMRREIEHADSLLSLLTLDYSIEDYPSSDPYILVDPVSEEVITGIVKQAYPGFSQPDVDRVVEFAQGFPGMAVLIAQAHLDKEPDIGRLRDPDLVDRLLWQRDNPNSQARNVIMVCSLFEHFGYDGNVTEQRVFAAERICRIDKDTFYRYAEDFIRHRILDRRGRFVHVVPFPLAITLAAEWWRGCSPELAKEISSSKMPAGMAEALYNQLAHLHFVPVAQDTARAMCSESGPFGQAEVLLSEQGSRLFRSLVEVNPEACVKALYRAIGDWSRERLLEVGPARRNLVWSLEKLCFWKDTFPLAARLMLALAAAENETWGNNATHQFLQLYHMYLSGTQAPPEKRVEIIDGALAGDSEERKILAVRALGSALETWGFSRMGGVEKQGSRPPSEDWQPKTCGDIYSYQDACIGRLTQVACTEPGLASLAKKELGQKIHGLLMRGRYDSIEKPITAIGSVSRGFWPEALHAIRSALKHEGGKMPPEIRRRVESWERLLTPTDLPERVGFTVSIPDHEYRKGEDGHYKDIAAERAIALAGELANQEQQILDNLPALLTGEQRQGYIFGHELARRTSNPDLFLAGALEALRRIPNGQGNPLVICGFLSGLRDRSLVTKVLEDVSGDDLLTPYLVELTRLSRPHPADLTRVIDAVKRGKIPLMHLNAFSYNSVIDHLPPKVVIDFCNQIAQFGVAGVACALDILYMFSFQNGERWKTSTPAFRRYLMTQGLIAEIASNPTFRGHSWDEISCSMLRPPFHDPELAVLIAQDIVAACSAENFSYNAEFYLSEVLKLLFSEYFDQVWPAIGSALLGKDLRFGRTFAFINGGMGRKEETGKVLAESPLPSLISWCEQNKPEGPRVIARMLPVIEKSGDNDYTWHPFARAFLEAFGADEEFLRDVSLNLHSCIWTGSLVPYYEMQIRLMDELSSHRHNQVQKWARRNTEWLKKEIIEERKREEENALGIY
jgi:hypothetical protein